MKKITAILLCVLIASAIPAAAGQNPAAPASTASGSSLSVRPGALGPLVEDQNIKLMLRDGTYVEGKVLMAFEDALTMKVKHSEPKDRLKKGENTIRTADISVVYMKKKGSVAVPIALGVAGGLGGFLAGAYAGYHVDKAQVSLGLGIGLAAAGAAGGALLGNEAVKRTLTINVTLPVHSGAAGRDSAGKN